METPTKLKLAIEKQQNRHIIKDIPLINTLKCSVEQGQYGVFIRLSRGSRWIAYPPKLWQKIINVIVHSGMDFVKLTPEKQVKVIQFKLYVSFQCVSGNFSTYINMNDEEWAAFKDKLSKLPCRLWKQHQVTPLRWKLLETQLNTKAMEDVKENNMCTTN